ncbi:MAG TPA: phenylphosphate carboxylase subunit delta [Stenotrophomonas sp.]|jgi:3-deoxy-D-manno-octulosonate 8-phosphate phosphatase (KDO 8-P phosphatase)
MGTYRGKIQLVLFDVDGVLTDGSLHFDGQGESIKTFNVRDGLAIALLRAHGIRTGVLSGRSSAPLTYRIAQLKFDVAVTGRLEKREAYAQILRESQLLESQIAYVGDDVVDLPLAGHVAYFYAPCDAHPLVLARADYVMGAAGGRGVAREVAEHVLMAGGLSVEQMYEPLLDHWNGFNAAQ